MPVTIQIEGLDALRARFAAEPQKWNAALSKTLEAVLLHIWEKVPGYPAKPDGSTYRRTGTLGRSLGIGQGGGKAGGPDIYEIRQRGGYSEASFGTRLEYAPYVIGERSTEQAGHMRHWWTLPNDVMDAAYPGIVRLFEVFVEEIARYLDSGQG